MLKHRRHHVAELQRLVDESPNWYAVVYEVSDRETAYDLEQALADKYKAEGILLNNVASNVRGGGGNAEEMSPERLAKLRTLRSGTKSSPEHRSKISQALMGIKRSRESIEKGAAKRRGRPVPDDLKQKASEVKDHLKKQISCEGNVYHGLREAAKAYGTERQVIRHRVRSHLPQWKEWFYL
jgi:hypothetical protein